MLPSVTNQFGDEIENLLARERNVRQKSSDIDNDINAIDNMRAYRHQTYSMLTNNKQLSYLESHQNNIQNTVPKGFLPVEYPVDRRRTIEMAGDSSELWTPAEKPPNTAPQEPIRRTQNKKRQLKKNTHITEATRTKQRNYRSVNINRTTINEEEYQTQQHHKECQTQPRLKENTAKNRKKL